MTGGVFSIPDQAVLSRAVNLTASMVDIATAETTTSTSFTNLATTGPAVTLTPGVTQNHTVEYSAEIMRNSGAGNSLASPAIAGATATRADSIHVAHDQTGFPITCSRTTLALAQASGATHTLKYETLSGTGEFANRKMVGLAL